MPYSVALVRGVADRTIASPAKFECSWTDSGSEAAWVRLAGCLDIATAPQVMRTLRELQSRVRLVVLDLRELEFLDSSGVHVIVVASIRARNAGHRLVLLRGSSTVDRLFGLTGTSHDVEIVDEDPLVPRDTGRLRLALVDGDGAG